MRQIEEHTKYFQEFCYMVEHLELYQAQNSMQSISDHQMSYLPLVCHLFDDLIAHNDSLQV